VREARPGAVGEVRYGVRSTAEAGNAGGGKDLSSRRTQDVVRDLGIGQPINSEGCSETADGVARESEGRSRLSLYALYDKISREDILAHRLISQYGRSNKGAPGVDGQDFADIEAYVLQRWLGELALALMCARPVVHREQRARLQQVSAITLGLPARNATPAVHRSIHRRRHGFCKYGPW